MVRELQLVGWKMENWKMGTKRLDSDFLMNCNVWQEKWATYSKPFVMIYDHWHTGHKDVLSVIDDGTRNRSTVMIDSCNSLTVVPLNSVEDRVFAATDHHISDQQWRGNAKYRSDVFPFIRLIQSSSQLIRYADYHYHSTNSLLQI